MGMYDTINWLDEVFQPRCKDGHPLNDLQTKDFDNTLAYIFVKDGVLYKDYGNDPGPKRIRSAVEGDTLKRFETFEYKRLTGTKTREFRVYTFCHVCRPVCFATPMSGTQKHLQAVGFHVSNGHPWVEMILLIDKTGKIIKSEYDEEATLGRDEYIRDRIQQGATILKETHPAAAAMTAEWEGK